MKESPSSKQHRQPLGFSLCTLMPIIFLMIGCARADVPDSERAILVSLYNSTNGPHWTHSDQWNTATLVCSSSNHWWGVLCNQSNTSVIGIFLFSNNLSGSLPDISGLTNLSYFSVGMNQLTGPAPNVAGFSQFQYLDISYNSFTGPPPTPPSTTPQDFFSSLCPNPLDRTPSARWDALVGYSPWYRDCGGYAPAVTIDSASPSPALVGMPITVKVDVRSLFPNLSNSVPTGIVVVRGSNQPDGECTLPALSNSQDPCDSASCTATLASGKGSCSLQFSNTGPHYLGATYNGSIVYYSYISSSFAVAVNAPLIEAPAIDQWWAYLALSAGLFGLAMYAKRLLP